MIFQNVDFAFFHIFSIIPCLGVYAGIIDFSFYWRILEQMGSLK